MSQSAIFRVSDLDQNAPTPFDLRPDAAALAPLIKEFGVEDLRKVRLFGEIRSRGKRDWELKATIGATIAQICVVSLEPMNTRIDTPVNRIFMANLSTPDEEEVEMPEDDSVEPLGTEIDVFALLVEALALFTPEFPRKEGAALGEAVFAEPGVAPMRDEDAKPFAGLAALKDALEKDT